MSINYQPVSHIIEAYTTTPNGDEIRIIITGLDDQKYNNLVYAELFIRSQTNSLFRKYKTLSAKTLVGIKRIVSKEIQENYLVQYTGKCPKCNEYIYHTIKGRIRDTYELPYHYCKINQPVVLKRVVPFAEIV